MQAFCHFMAFWHFSQKANCITKSAFSAFSRLFPPFCLFHWIRLLDFPALCQTVFLDQKHLFFLCTPNHEKLTLGGGSTVQLNNRRTLKTFVYCPEPILWKSLSKGTQQTSRERPRLHWQCLKGPRWTSNRQTVFWRAFQIKHTRYHHQPFSLSSP